ncbi:hypothetical protein [Methylobacterium sp. Leaf87]|uniref:hypothetical protein n=1 Tax=Methylobacterium sp. Leaf87 TaxID=1736243 RepID=UPI000A5983DE|nr:hypothetical protein [Methylobacterium sp. Leaf87]
MTWDEEIAPLRAATAARYDVFVRTRRSDLRWVTVIVGAYVVRIWDDTAVLMREAVASLNADFRKTLMQEGRIRRDPRGYTRWTGVVEIDLIHPNMLCSRMKTELLSGFGIDFAKIHKLERVVILHVHMIIDGRGHESWNLIDKSIRSRWSVGPRQVHFAEIYKNGTVSDNIKRLSDYSVKFKFFYSRGWLDRKTEYYREEYETKWIDYVQAMYRTIGLDNLTISSVSSRSSYGSRVYSNTSESVVEKQDSQALQLTIPTAHSDKDNTKPSYYQVQEYNPNGKYTVIPIHKFNVRKDNMRIKEILPYINLDKISDETLSELCDHLDRMGGQRRTSASLEAQYGDANADALSDLEVEQARLDLDQTRADVERSRAQAVVDLADAACLS